MGRHKKEISPSEMKKIGKLALDGCQNNTIEGIMDWPNEFIVHRPDIAKFLTKKRQERKANLYHAQTRNACVNDNHTMQIFLGVNELGQRDTKTHDIEPHTIADIAAAMGIAAHGHRQNPAT